LWQPFFRPGYAGAQSNHWGAKSLGCQPLPQRARRYQGWKDVKFYDVVVDAWGILQEGKMKIGKMVFVGMFAIGLGSSGACAQTATFTAVVAQVNTDAGTITLAQTLSDGSFTATTDYLASPVLLNQTTVGTTVQATAQWVSGYPAVIGLNGVFAMPQVAPVAPASSTPASTSPAISDPARLTPLGILQ
jgi:hypothetical protein